MKERRGASVVLTGASNLRPRNRFYVISTSKTSIKQSTLTSTTSRSSNKGPNVEVKAVLLHWTNSRNSVTEPVISERRE